MGDWQSFGLPSYRYTNPGCPGAWHVPAVTLRRYQRGVERALADAFLADPKRWCPPSWCSRRGRAALSGWFGRVHHAAGVGSMIAGSSPSGAMVSRLM